MLLDALMSHSCYSQTVSIAITLFMLILIMIYHGVQFRLHVVRALLHEKQQ